MRLSKNKAAGTAIPYGKAGRRLGTEKGLSGGGRQAFTPLSYHPVKGFAMVLCVSGVV
jgi:hypothetical protein